MDPLDRLPLAFDSHDATRLGLTRRQLDAVRHLPGVALVAPRVHAEAVPWSLALPLERHRALTRLACERHTASAVSHASAAIWHDLPHPCTIPARVWLTIERDRRVSVPSSWVVLHRSALPEEQVQIIDGCRVTTRARTVIDCFRSLPRSDALAIADRAVRDGTSLGELVDMRRHERRWPGVVRARVGLGLVDGRRESWLESASAVAFDRALLPRPHPQVEVIDLSGQLVGRVDVYFGGLRVAGEADGAGKFLGEFDGETDPGAVSRRLLAAEQRAERLRALGVGVARWTAADLSRPMSIRALIEAARPDRPLRAHLRCAACLQELPDCTCRGRLCMRDSRDRP